MSRYLILLPAPEAEWAALPPEAHQEGMASHGQFQQDLRAGSHTLVTVSPLEPSDRATSMRPRGDAGRGAGGGSGRRPRPCPAGGTDDVAGPLRRTQVKRLS